MALFYCKECGKQISDKAKTCPICGCPVDVSDFPRDDTVREAPVDSFAESILYESSVNNSDDTGTGFISKGNRSNGPIYKKPWFWIVIVVLLLIGASGASKKKKEEDLGPEDGIEVGFDAYQLTGKNFNDVETQLRGKGFTNIVTEAVPDLIVGILSQENEVSEVSIGGETRFKKKNRFAADAKIVIRYHTFPTSSEQSVSRQSGDTHSGTQRTIGINEEFGNNTITGVVTEVDLDYKGYNPYLVSVPEGSKVVLIVIKVTNISNSSNYVSVGDYRCYADNISVNAEILSTDKYDYNNNIDPGRSALLGACYVVPANVSSIELQYTPLGEKADKTIIKIQ